MNPMRHTQAFSTLAVTVVTLFMTLPVTAQPARPDPPLPNRIPSERPTLNDTRRATTEGTVEQYLMNPHGEVDGLLLNDGTQIHFPPHMSGELVTEIPPGTPITVQGNRLEGTSLVRAFAITNTQTTRTVVEHEPSWKDRRVPPEMRRLSMHVLQAQGPAQTLLYAPRGERHGVILADGTQVHVPPHIGEGLLRSVKVGDMIQVEGYGTENRYGRTLDATAIGLRGGQLIPVDGPRPLGGLDAPPAPRR